VGVLNEVESTQSTYRNAVSHRFWGLATVCAPECADPRFQFSKSRGSDLALRLLWSNRRYLQSVAPKNVPPKNVTMYRLIAIVLVILTVSTVEAQSTLPAQAQATLAEETASNTIRLEVFVRGDAERSKRAAEFAKDLAGRTSGLEVVIHDVMTDQDQLARLWKLSRRSGREQPVAPAFYCCDRMYFGFVSSEETGSAIESLFTADVYTRSTCPKCQAAKAFIQTLGPRWPALRFRIYEISNDPVARRRYEELCKSKGQLPGLPTIHFGGQTIIGYQGDQITGAQLENLIRRVAIVESEEPAVKPSEDDSSATGTSVSPQRATMLVGFWPNQTESHTSETAGNGDEVPAFDDLPLPAGVTLEDLPSVDSSPEAGPAEPPADVIDVPFFGELRVSRLGLPLFTFLVGLVDGFNPCAMWILVFLLSVLVNIKDRRKILLIAGTFVVVSGMAYYAFMAAWLNLFLLIGIARTAQVALGVVALVIGVINVKDFFAFKQGVTLSIPESSKPGIYKRVREIVAAKYVTSALVGVVILAVIVNMIELLCTAGLPALYTQVLTMHELSPLQNYAYLGLYILAYMLDDTILLSIVVATLSHRKLQEREGRWLKLLSGVVILALGLVMIFKPEWLQMGQ
jgi:glutaredoxin